MQKLKLVVFLHAIAFLGNIYTTTSLEDEGGKNRISIFRHSRISPALDSWGTSVCCWYFRMDRATRLSSI